MVRLQGHWGERLGGTFLDDFSLGRACRTTGESVLEEFLCFGVVAASIFARLQGHWELRFRGVFLDGFWQCRSCITIMGPKIDEVDPRWLQRSCKTANLAPLFFTRAWLRLSCRATRKIALEIHF